MNEHIEAPSKPRPRVRRLARDEHEFLHFFPFLFTVFFFSPAFFFFQIAHRFRTFAGISEMLRDLFDLLTIEIIDGRER